MKRKNAVNKRKFKFSKYKVIRNFAVIGLILFIFFSNRAQAYSDKTIYKTIVVSKGETLWDIAKNEKQNNEYYKNKSIREIIYSIQNTNSMSSSKIYENQKLKIIE